MGACKGDCRDQLGELTFLRKTFAQGFVRCTHCNYWMDWKFCHLKNNTPALLDSLGMFCNCCNYRVRQQPRSKKSKDILKDFKLDSKKSQTNLRNQMASDTTIEESREIIQKIKDEIQSRKKVQKYEKKISENSRNDEVEDDDVIDTGKTLDELRELFEEKFSDNPQLLKQFQRLEKYLIFLPNEKKYQNVNYFLY